MNQRNLQNRSPQRRTPANTMPGWRESASRISRILIRLANSGANRKLETILLKLHPADIAEALLGVPTPVARKIVRVLYGIQKAGSVLSEMPSTTQGEILAEMDADIITDVIRRLEPDDAVDLLQSLDEDTAHAIMSALKIEEVSEIEELLLYGEDSAGGLMTTDVFRLESTLKVRDAIAKLRSEKDLEGVQYLYVVDEWNHLIGSVDFKILLFANDEDDIAGIMTEHVHTVLPHATDEKVAREMAKYDLLEIAVVDSSGHLIGIITIDDVIDVIQETATEEIYALAGLDEEDRVFSSPMRSIRLRLPWLSINLVTAATAATVIGAFQSTIKELVFLAMVFPVVASTGGNAAIQTITVIVRGFTLGELQLQNAMKAVTREFLVGLGNGVMIGIVAATVAYFWRHNIYLSGVLFGAIVLNFMNAALIGTIVPVLLKRFRLDPAVASSIFVTASTDVGGYLIFLALATHFAEFLV